MRARRAVENGQYRKAIQALSSGGLAQVTPKVLDEMVVKHPQAPPLPSPLTLLQPKPPSPRQMSSRP